MHEGRRSAKASDEDHGMPGWQIPASTTQCRLVIMIHSPQNAAGWCLTAAMLWAALASSAVLAEGSMTGAVKPLGSVRFAPDKDVRCLFSALETGDPATGPSTWILKAPAGCVVPWHSHTAEEQLIVIRGTVVAEMTNHPPTRLGPGGFAVMGGHMPHQFSCLGKVTCMTFVTFDRPYDIRWGKT
jgi:mannose-6-phosphate isomerase-like protein (cupin superfamily)